MSIENHATKGATGDAERARQTEEGRAEQRTNLLAMAAWYAGKGDRQRARECREKAEGLT